MELLAIPRGVLREAVIFGIELQMVTAIPEVAKRIQELEKTLTDLEISFLEGLDTISDYNEQDMP